MAMLEAMWREDIVPELTRISSHVQSIDNKLDSLEKQLTVNRQDLERQLAANHQETQTSFSQVVNFMGTQFEDLKDRLALRRKIEEIASEQKKNQHEIDAIKSQIRKKTNRPAAKVPPPRR